MPQTSEQLYLLFIKVVFVEPTGAQEILIELQAMTLIPNFPGRRLPSEDG